MPSLDSTFFSKKYSNSELNRQMFADTTAEVNKPYYYKVCAVDNNGNKGEYSDPAFALMKLPPVSITYKANASKRFEDFRPTSTVSIVKTEPGYELKYSLEDSRGTKDTEKYTGEIHIAESAIIDAVLYKAEEEEPLLRHRRLVS